MWFFLRKKDQFTLGVLCSIAFLMALRHVALQRPLPKESAVFPDYAFMPSNAERASFRQAQESGELRVPLQFEPDYRYLVDLNHAGKDELCILPEIGPALAQRILDYRAENGPFSSCEELMKVKGIGEKKFAVIKPYLKEL